MSISTDGGSDAQSPNCPDCGDDLDYEIITEDGTEHETTKYAGWWCRNCVKGMTHCEHCADLHHPDRICEAERKARLEAAQEAFGGTAAIPGHGAVDVDDLETIGEGTPVFILEDGCPEDDCDGDLVYHLVSSDDFAEGEPSAEYEPVAEHCSNFDHQDDDACTYHRP